MALGAFLVTVCLCIRGGSSIADVTDAELSTFMNDLWHSDANAALSRDYNYNLQGHTSTHGSTDQASQSLFTYLDPDILHRPTYSTFISLLDNFYHQTGRSEHQTNQENAEITRFFTEISSTEVMKQTQRFLHSKGLVGSSWQEFETLLKHMWFTFYPRVPHSSQAHDSCGFEHVFVGETESNKVTGLHFWVQFYLQEKKGLLNYLGYIFTRSPGILSVHFSWYDKLKNLSTFVLGSSPEFDLAMYTTCVLLRPNRQCTFSMAGHTFNIKSYTISYESGHVVSTAYVYD